MKNFNGNGTVYKLNGNRRNQWAARVTLGWSTDGKQIRKYIGTFPTKKAAQQALMAYSLAPDLKEENSQTLGSIYKVWAHHRYSKVSESTINMYESAWQKLKPLEHMPIQNIKKNEIQRILDRYEDQSNSLVRQIKSLASQLFDHAIENDYVDKNYAKFAHAGGSKPKEKEIFSDEAIATLWKNKDLKNVDTILGLIYTGLRLSAFFSLPKSKVYLNKNYIQHGSKTQAGKDRIIPIHHQLKPLLERRMSVSKVYVFEQNGRQYDASNYRNRIYYPLLEELDLPRLTPHSCRHTFASLLSRSVEDKVLISRLLGHTDYALTANVYTHKEVSELITAVNKI